MANSKNTSKGKDREKRFQARYGMSKINFWKLKKTDPKKAHELKMEKTKYGK